MVFRLLVSFQEVQVLGRETGVRLDGQLFYQIITREIALVWTVKIRTKTVKANSAGSCRQARNRCDFLFDPATELKSTLQMRPAFQRDIRPQLSLKRGDLQS